MSSLAAQTVFTPEEYLTLERKATVKSEYLNGEIRAMPRVNFAHNLITVDIATELNIQSRGQDWEVYMSNMRVRTGPKGAYFYPDVVVFCGEPEVEDNVFDTLLNPTLVIEVPSTEVYDRGEKFSTIKNSRPCGNTSSFHKIGFGLNSIALPRRSGCRPSFALLRTCCRSFPSAVNYLCGTFIDAFPKSFCSAVNCLRPTFRK